MLHSHIGTRRHSNNCCSTSIYRVPRYYDKCTYFVRFENAMKLLIPLQVQQIFLYNCSVEKKIKIF